MVEGNNPLPHPPNTYTKAAADNCSIEWLFQNFSNLWGSPINKNRTLWQVFSSECSRASPEDCVWSDFVWTRFFKWFLWEGFFQSMFRTRKSSSIHLFQLKDKACKIAPNCPLDVNDQDSGEGSAGLTITARITIWGKISVVFYCPKLTTDLIFVIQEEFSI